MMGVGMSLSHPVMSIGQGLVMLAGAWQIAISQHFQKPSFYALCVGMLFVLPLLSGIYTDNYMHWLTLMRVKFPLLLFPIFALQLPSLTPKQYAIFSLSFIVTQSIVAILSFSIYFISYDNGWAEIKTHIEKNGTIDIITHIHHIYFGLFLAFSVIMAGLESLKTSDKKKRFLLGFLALVNFILIHLLTSRTGFFTLYLGIATTIVYYIIRNKKYIWGTILLIGLMATPTAAYFFVPTVHSRLALMKWELQEFYVAKNLTDGSMSKRILAWEVTSEIIKEYPLIGIGAGGVGDRIKEGAKAKMQDFKTIRWDMDETKLLSSPHNQYLENFAACGVLGLLVLLLVLGIPLFTKNENLLVPVFIIMITATMMTESFLERQWGVVFLTTFLSILGFFKGKEGGSE
jgi:O-antigen ligase